MLLASETPHHDVCIVGTGFSGLAMAIRLLRSGRRDLVVLERAGEVGGTWRANGYPGCACDVPSHLYSFSFAPNPDWSSTYSPQPEIKDYLTKVATDEGVLPYVKFDTELEDATWDAAANCWRITTTQGDLTARVLVSAPGPLTEPRLPDVPGIETFQGTVFHSARWNHDHDLAGERVAVVGTGASAIQFVPQIQPTVGRLHLFQRTAPWVMPRTARPISGAERALFRALPITQKAVRTAIYWGREAFAIPMLHAGAARVVKAIATKHLERSIPDAELRRKVTPDYLPGCKRILVSNDYLPSLTKPNVNVITSGVKEITEHSVIGHDGTEVEVDTIIFGTGFHVTDLPLADHIHAGGQSLTESFAGSMVAYNGTSIAGFPNLFWLLGPNTGLGHSSVVFMAETQTDYIVRAIQYMETHGVTAIEPTPAAQSEWRSTVDAKMNGTVWTTGGCKSWYMDATGRNSTLWPDYTFNYARRLRTFDPTAYATYRAAAPVAEVAS